MSTLAAEFGIDLEEALHTVPFAFGEQLYHCAMVRAGWKVKAASGPCESPEAQMERLAELEAADDFGKPDPEMEAAMARWGL